MEMELKIPKASTVMYATERPRVCSLKFAPPDTHQCKRLLDVRKSGDRPMLVYFCQRTDV